MPHAELVAFDLPCAIDGCTNEITIRSHTPHEYLRAWFDGALVYCFFHRAERHA